MEVLIADLEKYAHPVASGVTSRSYQVNKEIFEVERSNRSSNTAEKRANLLRKEYERTKKHLAGNIIEATIAPIRIAPHRWKVVIRKPVIHGTPLREVLEARAPGQPLPEEIHNFFCKCHNCYCYEDFAPNLISDILYNPLRDPRLSRFENLFKAAIGTNVVLRDGVPILKDITLNPLLRWSMSRPILSRIVDTKVTELLGIEPPVTWQDFQAALSRITGTNSLTRSSKSSLDPSL